MIVFINVVTVIVLLLLFSLSVYKGYKRGALKTLIRLGVLICSVVLGFFIAKLLATHFYDKVVTKISNALMENKNLSVDVDSMGSLLILIKALLVPVTFVLVSVIIDKILLLVYYLITKRIQETQSETSKRVGVLISIITLLIGFSTAFLPINGYIGLVNKGETQLSQTVLAEKYNGVFKTCGIVGDSALFKATTNLSCKAFDALGKAEYTGLDGKKYKMSTSKEFLGICEIYPKLEELITAEENTDFVGTALSALDYKGDNSILSVKIAVTNVLRMAGEKWGNGEEFLSLNVKERIDPLNEAYFPAVKPILNKLATCTEENLVEYLSSVDKLLKALDKSQVFVEKLKTYADKLPEEIATAEELDSVVKEMASLYDLMDEINRSTFYEVIKITVNSFTLAGQDDPCFSYFFGIVIENLRDVKDEPIYFQQVKDANQALTDIFILLNKEDVDINFRFNRILDKVVIEDGIMYNAINDIVVFNVSHENIVMLKVTASNKVLADSYIGGTKPSYIGNKNVYNTLEYLKNLIIVGK